MTWSARGVIGGMLLAVATGVEADGARAQEGVPPDTVRTLFDGDTIPGMGAVGGVVVDALGFVYVADFRNSVWRYTPEGRVEKYADGFYGASGNAIGPRGELYQSSFNGHYVSRIERDGTVRTWVDEGLNGPVGMAAAADGTLFVVNCNGNTVSRVAPDRTVSTFADGPLFACPNGITFDDRGDLYVVNFGNTHVVRITPDGQASSFTQVPGAGGNGHITFARGDFYVTKFRAHQVFRVSADGSFSVLAGTGAQGQTDGPAWTAQMSQPNGIAASPSGTTLYVNDLVSGSGVAGGAARSTLRMIRLVVLTDVLAAAEPGPEPLEAAYRAYHAARPDENTTTDAIALAYQYFSGPRGAEGVRLFQLNAETFPDDPNSQYHLGEAYRYIGRAEQAAEQYRKVLDLAPGHALAAQRLEAVQGG
ncbi:MAG: hypothetical protein RJQ04_11160 [Longimicrobiales bacterium]